MDSDNSAQPEDSIRRGKNTGGGGAKERKQCYTEWTAQYTSQETRKEQNKP